MTFNAVLQQNRRWSMATVCGYSRLANEKVEQIHQLEKEIGTTILAFSCGSLEYANLTGPQISRLQDAEKKLGVSLVAVSAV
jgi:hypothetical protein